MNCYGLIGFPISHSLSPVIWQLFARQLGIDLDYQLWPVPPDQLDSALFRLVKEGIRGFNVTAPFKQAVCAQVTQLSARAVRAGAVNTVSVRPDGSTYGDNTDGIGLIRDLTQRLQFPLQEQRIALIGAGGAAAGIMPALFDAGPAAIVIYNRTPERASQLAGRFLETVSVGVPGQQTQPFDLVIHAGFAGTESVLPDIHFASGSLAYDLTYGQANTAFMNWAGRQGAAFVSDGLGMLVEQAAEAFALFEKYHPETASVLSKLTSC